MKYTDVQQLRKQAAKQKMIDVGGGWSIQDTGADALADALYIQSETRPMSFGRALVNSMPAALLAAAIGGAGSLAISGGNLAAGGVGAGGSFIGTALFNAILNAGKQNKTVAEALAERGYAA